MNSVTEIVFVGVLLSAGRSTRVGRNHRMVSFKVGGRMGGREEGRKSLVRFWCGYGSSDESWTLFFFFNPDLVHLNMFSQDGWSSPDCVMIQIVKKKKTTKNFT